MKLVISAILYSCSWDYNTSFNHGKFHSTVLYQQSYEGGGGTFWMTLKVLSHHHRIQYIPNEVDKLLINGSFKSKIKFIWGFRKNLLPKHSSLSLLFHKTHSLKTFLGGIYFYQTSIRVYLRAGHDWAVVILCEV